MRTVKLTYRAMITYCFTSEVWWVKFAGLCLHVKKTPPLFSERYGYVKFYRLWPTKWRASLTRK